MLCSHHRSLDRAWLSMTAEAIDADVQRLGRLADARDPVRREGLPDTGGGNRHQSHLNPGFEAFKPGQSIRHMLDRHEVHWVCKLGHRGIAMSVPAKLAAPHRFWPHRSLIGRGRDTRVHASTMGLARSFHVPYHQR
jgi:hypothetical protein